MGVYRPVLAVLHGGHLEYRVRLFGILSLSRGGAALPLPARLDARLLLAYLLVNRQRIHSRSTLLGHIWPELPEARARRALSQALWQVRSALPGAVQADRDSLQIDPAAPLWIDVAEFESRIEPDRQAVAGNPKTKEDLEQAIQLYQGDLLEGFYVDWVLEERRRLREKCYHALEGLVQLEKGAGHYQNALDLALILATADPLRETAHREVMRLYYFLKRPQAAQQQFAICRNILQGELGIEPEAETVALAHEIALQSGHSAVPGEETHSPYLPATQRPLELPIADKNAAAIHLALVGRDAERALLLRHVEAIFNGAGGSALIEGEAGIGKTRLVREIARDAEWRGAQVLWGKAGEHESPGSLLIEAIASGLSPLRAEQLTRAVDRPWIQILRPNLPALSQSSPESIGADANAHQAEQSLVITALTHLLAAWAQITPLLIVLEDLQWADPDSLECLVQLNSRLRNMGLLLIGTYRGEEVRIQPHIWDKLQSLDRTGLLARLKLAGLDPEAVGDLIRRALGMEQFASDLLTLLYQETGGNPLYLLESLRTLYDEGFIKRDPGGKWLISRPETEDIDLPLSKVVESIIAYRLRQLPPILRQVLSAAAVLGYYFDAVLLCAVSGLDSRSDWTALRELVQRQLLSETPQDYRFSHGKVRQVIYNGLLTEERLWLHSRAAMALEQLQPRRFDLLAYHFAKAEVWDKAAYYHQQAGRQACAALDYTTAVKHFGAAVALVGPAGLDESGQFGLLAAREEALAVLGNRSAQMVDLEAMARLARSARQLTTVQCRRAHLLAPLGRYAEAEAAAREAVASAQSQSHDDAPLVFSLATLGKVLLWRGDLDQAHLYLQAAVERSSQGAPTPTAMEAHYALALNLLHLGDHSAARSQVERAAALAAQCGDAAGQTELFVVLGAIAAAQGVIDEAKVCYQRAIDLSRAIGYLQNQCAGLLGLGHVLFLTGQLGEALKCYEGALAISQQIDHRSLQAAAHVRIADALLVLGDVESASAKCAAAWTYGHAAGDLHLLATCSLLTGKIARQRGETRAARKHLEASLAALGEPRNKWAWDRVRAYLELASLEIDESSLDTAVRCADVAMAICDQTGMAGLAAHALAIRGKALLAQKQIEGALAAATQAIIGLESALGRTYLIPLAYYEILAALERNDEARGAIEEAYRLLTKHIEGFPVEQQRQAIESAPEHRAIVAAWEAFQPKRATVRLPRAGAPLGRPLRDEEWTEITWTVSLPEDELIPGKVARRQHCLLRLLREAADQNAAPTLEHLARALRVSVRTIAGDMAALRKRRSALPPTRHSVSKAAP